MPMLGLSAAAFTTAATAATVTTATTAAATAAASAAFTATLTSIAIKVGINVAISAAMSLLQPNVGAAGRTFEWTLDPDGPIPFAAGRIGVAGSAVYRRTFGPDLMYYGIPSVLSGSGPIDGFEGFMADDEVVTFDASGKAISSQYQGELWYKNSLGQQPATAIASPTGLKNNVSLIGWTAANKLSGKAAYMIVMGENSKGTAYPTGEIKPLVTLRGLKGWDPRQDSSYPGGSGPCRLHDPSTWVYITNPIIWALKWSLGLWEGPTGKGAPQVDYQVGGIGAKLSGIDVPAFVSAANVADANGWTVAAYPTTDDDKAQVLDAFLQAGGAIYAQRAGKISCIQRAAPRASIVTISAADTAGPLEIDTAASRIDRINTLRPRFWSEAHRWQMTALPEVTAASYQTEDGGKRTRGLDLHYVSNATQAAQLAALQIANTREGIAGIIPLKPHLQRIRPGDAFTITEAGFVLNGLKCLCLNTDYDPSTGVVRVSFVSESDGKYPFAMGQSPTPPAPPVLTPVDPREVSPPLLEDWVIVVRPPAPGGTQLPGFDLTGIVSNATATAIIVEHGPTEEGPWTTAYQGPPTVTTIPIDGLQSGETYFIAIQYQRGQNYSDRMVYGPYTAPDLIANVDPELIQAQIDEATASLQLALTQLQAAQEALNTLVETANADFDSRLNAVDTGLSGLQSGQINLQEQIDGRATTSQLNFQINRIDGQQSIIGTLQDTVNDLPNQFVSTTNYETLLAEVANARGPYGNLAGRFSAQQQAIVDGLTGKVDVSAFTSLSAEVADARGGRPSIAVHLADLVTARINADGALGQRVDDTQAWLNLTDGAVGGLLTRMVTVEAGLDGKASVTAVENALAVSGTASANASEALTLAASADGKASASWSATFDVNGYQSGWTSFNNGTIAVTAHRADLFRVEMPGNPADRVDLSGVYGLRIYKANVKRVHIGFK